MLTTIIGIFEEGFVYAIMSLGVYITYKILDFPDLSVDGTYPLGAAVAAALIAGGMNPVLVLPIAFLAGVLAGCITGLIHVKLKVRDLLSGIIVSIALYSINLRVAGGKSNLPIFSKETIFQNSFLTEKAAALSGYTTVLILFGILLFCKVLLDLYLRTRSGYLLRAACSNDTLVTSLAKDKGFVKILGLAIANGFAALAGCIMAQKQGFFEVTMGTGTIVIGLANVIIGTQLFRHMSFVKATTAVIVGSVIYKACVAFAINNGMAPGDLKLVTAVLFLGILVLSNLQKSGVKHGAGSKKQDFTGSLQGAGAVSLSQSGQAGETEAAEKTAADQREEG